MPPTVLIARLSLREAVRGRAVRALAVLAVLLLALFGLACAEGMAAARRSAGSANEDLIGATLLGTAAFTVLLLGAIVAVGLAHGTVRGDAESGLLQPLLVRPVPRTAVVLGRTLAAALVAGTWTALLWLATVLVMRLAGHWSAPAVLLPALALGGGAMLVAVTATAASAWLGPSTAGMVALGLVGLGFTSGLLAQLGSTLDIASLRAVADACSVLLPFEALYRDVLFRLNGSLGDLSRLGIATGPFGGARAGGPWLPLWAAVWSALLGAATVLRVRRIDL